MAPLDVHFDGNDIGDTLALHVENVYHSFDLLALGVGSFLNGSDTVNLSPQTYNAYNVDYSRLTIADTEVPDPIPEPATMLLLGTGLVGVAGAARRRKKNQA